jgi:hypothetical protein
MLGKISYECFSVWLHGMRCVVSPFLFSGSEGCVKVQACIIFDKIKEF